MTQTPAGWYPDGHGSQRWWDGSQWTEHTMPASGGAPEAAADASPETSADSSSPAEPEPAVDPHSEPTRVAGSSPLPPAGGQPADQPPSAPPAGAPYGGAPAAPGYGAPATPGYGAPAAPGGYPQQGGYPPAGGGYPGPGYGYPQGGGYPGQPKKGLSGKLIGLIGGGVLALIIVIVLVIILSTKGGGSDATSPSGVAKDFFDKAKDANCAAFDDVDTSSAPQGMDLKAQCESHKDQIFSDSTCGDSSLSTSNEQITGDTATVDIKITGGGSDCEESDTWSFNKIGGDWKVDPSSIGVDAPSTSVPDVPTPSGF